LIVEAVKRANKQGQADAKMQAKSKKIADRNWSISCFSERMQVWVKTT